MKILIVDDYAQNRKLLRLELESEQHKVIEATDGVEALKIAVAESIDAIVSDVLMPNMDGFRLCHEIRSQKHLAGLPFIIYTSTYDSPSDRQLGETVGADSYLVRPVRVKVILEAISSALDKTQAQQSITTAANTEYIVKSYNAALVDKLEEKNTELAKTNNELRIVRDQLTRLLEHSPVVIYSLKIEGVYITPFLVSDNITRLLGIGVKEAFSYQWWVDHLHPEDRELAVAGLREIFNSGARRTHYRVRHQKGHYVWVEDSQRVVYDANKKPLEITGVWTDITERKQNEERLREQAELLDIASDAILVKNLEEQIEYWSKGAERMFGWTATEVRGRRVYDFLIKMDSNSWQARQTLLKHGEWSGEIRKVTKAGAELSVQTRWTLLRDEHGKPKAILSINTDVTEKKKLEAQFLRTQRLESIGTLASGIAHDLNNVLAPIIMSISLLREKATNEDERHMLEILQQNARRGSDIVSQVLAFGRGVQGERIPVVPKHLIKELNAIIKETFPKNIQLELKTDSNLWNVVGDPTQLHQVFLNLCINARDAMPAGGQLTLIAQNVVLDESHKHAHPNCSPGNYILFQFCDTGTGIPPEVLDRIFEPFFTTKEIGRGTGLGLSTVAAILKSHGGHIHVCSQINKGTDFKVYLPASTDSVKDDELAQPAELPCGHGECILLVDDEEVIIHITQKILERFGYKVLTATDGAGAIAIYAQNRRDIDVIVTDMNMPVMDGPSLIRALLKIDPAALIISASGFGSDNDITSTNGTGVQKHLRKPYSADVLLKSLHEVIANKTKLAANN